MEHNTLTGTSVHEDKLISTAGTSDAGKVSTPSASVAGTGVLRNLTESEISSKQEFVMLYLPAVDTETEYYAPVGFTGTLTSVRTTIDDAFTGADHTLQVKVNGTSVTNGLITITQSGSAAGDVDTASPTTNNTVSAGQYIQVTSGAEASSTLNVYMLLTFTRTG